VVKPQSGRWRSVCSGYAALQQTLYGSSGRGFKINCAPQNRERRNSAKISPWWQEREAVNFSETRPLAISGFV
jgi:hypothetical protein